jgi:radical SAM superfamily enzyme YgiQ (UPF0313 family)
MKVLLISVNNEKEPYPVSPLGAVYIAQALKNKEHEVGFLDLCFVDNDYRAVYDSLKRLAPDVIGISLRNIDNLTYNKSIFYLPRIRDIVNFIKKYTSSPLVVGGSGFSIFSEDILRCFDLTFGIVGEGEQAFPLFCDALSNGYDVYDIPNICYIRDGKFKLNAVQFGPVNYFPDRTLLNNRKYLEFGGMANIQSKRGCPFKCIYCTYPSLEGKKLRLREPGSVLEELKEMQSNYGIDYVFFVDDIFNFPKEHAVGICEEIIRNNLKIDWTCFATPKDITPELVRLMKIAGCKGVEFGSDSGSDKTLKGLGKHFTAEDIAYAAACCNEIDLPNAHYIIIGGPDEDYSTLKETFKFFGKNMSTAVIVLVGIRIYPNTKLCEKAREDNILEKDKNLLEPVFYLSPEIDINTLLQKVSEHAEQRNNWIVPALNIRSDTKILAALRRLGKRGTLWDMLSI